MTQYGFCDYLKTPVDSENFIWYLTTQFIDAPNEEIEQTIKFVDEITRLKKAYPDVPGGTFLTLVLK